MTEWIRAKILGKGTTERKNFIWNMAGSGVFAAVSMLLSFYVIRVMGEDIGGIFSIAITLSQMFAYIMYFEMRTYQVTDVERRFTFAQYHGTKVWLGVLMMLVCISYMFVRGYDLQKAGIILLMCIYRLIDGYADLYEGTFQQEEIPVFQDDFFCGRAGDSGSGDASDDAVRVDCGRGGRARRVRV